MDLLYIVTCTILSVCNHVCSVCVMIGSSVYGIETIEYSLTTGSQYQHQSHVVENTTWKRNDSSQAPVNMHEIVGHIPRFLHDHTP